MLTRRLLLLRIIILAAFVAFTARLAFWQLWQGGALREASKRNHLRWVRLPAKRGLIVDRAGAVLATNTPAPAAWLVSGEVGRKDWDDLLQRLTDIGVFPDLETATDTLAEARRHPTYLPQRLLGNLTMEQVTRVEEELPFLRGVYVSDEPLRSYPNGEMAAHVLGYLREIDANELEANKEQGYRQGDNFGKSGLEKAFETDLRGQEGAEEVEVDARGAVLRRVSTDAPHEGSTLTLTLDSALQRTAEDALRGHVGAVVALDPSSGDILAMASAPTYNATKMSGRLSPESWGWLKKAHALVNRGTERYPPGSVFKIVTAATVLEQGVVSDNTYFFCPGVYQGIHCWKHNGHGTINLTEAIAQSCNVSFMHMAEKAGLERMATMARRFGLGKPTGLELPEKHGLIPNPAWVKETGRRWQPGDTLQVGIGQSYLTITPLQGARVAAAIANGGKLVHPRLVQRIGDDDQPLTPPTPIGLQDGTLRSIARGLRAVTGEGTAKSMDPSLHIAGKTGTAQNPGGDHAWFIGYAPTEHPTIAIAVLVEHGGHGGAVAAPIAEAVIRAALKPATTGEGGAQ